jgi:hypothetical protein
MVSSKEVITNVVSRLEEARREDLHSLHSEYQDSHRSINDLIESWKRKIIETGSITNYKKSKVDVYVCEENIDPNVVPLVQKNSIKKQALSPVVTSAAPVAETQAESTIEAATNNGPSQVKGLNVDSMKVSELREELRLRNLDDRGKKKMLQERLQQDIDQRSGHETKVDKEEEFTEERESESNVQEEVTEPVTEDDVEMIESTDANENVAEPEPTQSKMPLPSVC